MSSRSLTPWESTALTRCDSPLMEGAEGLDDINSREENAKDVQGKISALAGFVRSMLHSNSSKSSRMESIDQWLENQIQKHIANVSANLD